jgi:hypothetical protein
VFFLPYLALVLLGGAYSLLNGTFPKLGVRWTYTLFTDPLFVVILIVLLVSSIFYIAWNKRLPQFFGELLKKELIVSKQAERDTTVAYTTYIKSYKKFIWSKWRYLFVGLSYLFYFIFIIASRPYSSYFRQTGQLLMDIIGFLHLTVMYVLFPIIVLYLIGVAIWNLFATGRFIHKLPEYFELKIRPNHPDKSGGLKIIGDFCFRMVLPLLLSIASMSVIVIFINFSWWENTESNTLSSLLIIFLPLVLLITFYAFLGPLWGIHTYMEEVKNNYEEKYANRLGDLLRIVERYIEFGELDQAEKSRTELELLNVLHPEKMNYPAWPFDTQLFIKFLVPQIFPVISYIISSKGDFQLQGLVDFLGAMLGN